MDRRAFVGTAGAWAAGAGLARAQDAALPDPPSAIHPITLFDLEELEGQAQKLLPPGPFAFVAGGVGAEWTLHENRRAFGRYVIEPQYLAGKPPPDLTTTLLGARLSAPLITTPVGGMGLLHRSADVGCAMGTMASGLLMTASGASTNTLEQIASAIGPGPKWYQIYMPADRGEAAELMQRVRAAGYTAVVFTIDALGAGNSESLQRTGFPTGQALQAAAARLTAGAPGAQYKRGPQKRSYSWDDVAFIQKASGLPVLLKGVLTPQLAVEGIRRGAAGIQVSNHGGRQIDTVPAAIDALGPIAEAVKGRIPIIVDSGFRRGTDVFKALALGGAEGVKSVYDKLKQELTSTMQAAGAGKISDITRAFVARGES